MKNPLKKDLLLIVAVLMMALCFYIGNRFLNRTPAMMVEISVDGTIVEELDLFQDTTRVISGYQGGTNTLVIENGAVSVTEASCPDHLCRNQGKIRQSGEMIVCLPNRMIAKITGGKPLN